jgi:dTDP-glucose 4,6-dehydratase
MTRDVTLQIMRGMRLMVTGGAGFIGSNFIRYWFARHARDEIVNVDLLTYAGDLANVADVARAHGDRYAFERADICDAAAIDAIVAARRPDVIVNFAAESHNSRGVLDPGAFMRTNALGTQTLLEAARQRNVPRFHHISTCEVFGDLSLDTTESFTETSPFRPRTPYNASKAAAELIVQAYHLTFGLATTVTNCSNNYGPWQHPEKVIPLFATNALDDEPLPLYRQSQNRREWLHVDDHCAAIELVLDRGRFGETYNVGSGEERSVEEIADAILEAADKPKSLKSYVDDRPGHDRRYLLDHSKITRELGWRPAISFDRGLRQTFDWYRTHREWWSPKKALTKKQVDETAWRRPAETSAR